MAYSGTRIAFALAGALALAALSGCGSGSSMGSTGAGTTVTASFSGATMPSAVAYQSGTSGTFKALALSGSSSVSFTLPSGTTAYGFAYMCPTFNAGSSFSNESIIQATTTDTTSLSLACPSLSGNVSATFDVSAIPGATSVVLYVNYWSEDLILSQPTGSVGLFGIPTGTFDVALVAEGAKGALAIQILRGVSVTGSTNVAFPSMTAADELGSAPASITNVPSGTTAGFETTYQTSGGLSVILPGPFNGAPQSTYPTVPSSQSQSGDFYLIQAVANLAQPSESLTALVSSSTASAVTATLPAPSSLLTAPMAAAFPTFNANTSGFTVQGTIVDSSWTQFQTAVNQPVYNVYTYVTKNWLGTNTTFTVPNLSALPGFAPAPPSGGREFWNLYSTAGTPLQFNPLQQSGLEFLSSPTSVQSISYGGYFTVP
ncbi:MAG: hypothetical protein ACYCSP_05595 [Acidobacteriaceae bacterium]